MLRKRVYPYEYIWIAGKHLMKYYCEIRKIEMYELDPVHFFSAPGLAW